MTLALRTVIVIEDEPQIRRFVRSALEAEGWQVHEAATLREGLLFERRLFDALFSTEDQAEGMAAFAEKRSPQFRGK